MRALYHSEGEGGPTLVTPLRTHSWHLETHILYEKILTVLTSRTDGSNQCHS